MPRRLIQYTTDEVLQELPDIASLDVSAATGGDTISAFVCAVGFEPRCTELARLLSECGARPEHSIILRLSSNTAPDEANAAELMAILEPISGKVSELNADGATYVEELTRLLGDLGDMPAVIFDISVGANRLILRSMCALIQSDASVEVWYTEAETYYPARDDFEANREQWMGDEELGTEFGVMAVSPSIESTGEHLDSLPDAVVVFPSFRHERSGAAISHVDPVLHMRTSDNVVWILGRPHLEQNLWRRDAMREINRVGDDACVREASTFDYKDTYRVLEQVYLERWERNNITISPLGSKMQAVGTSLFCYRHPDVRVLFATPKQYNAKQWSDGCRATWRISFGSMLEVRQALGRIGSIELRT